VIVEQLANEAAELLSRGLHRDYLEFNAELASPRGRIGFEEVAQGLTSAKASIACTYYNRSEAILLNRVLLAGLQLAGRVGTDSRLTARVFRLAQSLEASVPTMRLTRVDLDNARRAIDRRSTAYTSALTLIELLFDGMGVSLEEVAQSVQIPGFLFDMNRFFQSLMSRFLHEELREFSVQDERRLKHMFEYVPGRNPKLRRAVVPRPDFAVLRHGDVVEFLDAKYRDLWQTSLPRDMLYQLTIYALAKDTGLPRSTILYPTLAGEAADQVVSFKDPVLGHQRAEITLRPVNLLEMEKVVQPRRGALAARQRREYARALVFGNRRDAHIRVL
jgi:5-methylcytosine-specific restriction enzyme subunit McrC